MFSTGIGDLVQHVWTRVRPVGWTDWALVAQVSAQGDELKKLSDGQLRSRADELRTAAQAANNSTAADNLLPALAMAAEAIRRTMAVTLYDVQILAGLVLARGAVAEMQTGEGKTFSAALPAVFHALNSRSVHLATPNSYLAERDFKLLAPTFELLGIRPGLLRSTDGVEVKRAAYAAEITYGTGYDFGFDYLRDQLLLIHQARPGLGQRHRQHLSGAPHATSRTMQRGHAVALIDEIDSVLIDEACHPLIISESPSQAHPNPQPYFEARKIAQAMEPERDFLIDPADRVIFLTPAGLKLIHNQQAAAPAIALNGPWSQYVEQALTAEWLRRRDVDYIIDDGKLRLVDEFTGRIFSDRSWQHGLQQAVEAKEGLTVTAETAAAASISRQRYFRRYATIAGLTGTAAGSQREFWHTYRLAVVEIPLRTPSRRLELPTRYFAHVEAKWQAVVSAIAATRATGRPVLVGTRTIENSELLARRLQALAIPFRLLNGKQDESEALVVAEAGQVGMVTIATNMAGRGTDIKLAPEAAQRGGLHLIGVERHESVRIDRQLAGRVARQGDPGSFQFFVSADDPLLERFGSGLAERLRRQADACGEIRHDFSGEIEAIQRRIERDQYHQRCRLMTYDRWLDQARDKLGTGG